VWIHPDEEHDMKATSSIEVRGMNIRLYDDAGATFAAISGIARDTNCIEYMTADELRDLADAIEARSENIAASVEALA
jgi:hypothetical protein